MLYTLPIKIKHKIKIIEIYLKNRSQFHMFKTVIDSIRTIQHGMMFGRSL